MYSKRIYHFGAFLVAVGMMLSCTDDNMSTTGPDKPGEGPGNPEIPETISIELDREVEESGMYFGDFWQEGYANYYFELTDGEVGGLESGHTAPMNEGDYIMCFDLWGGDFYRPC